MDEGEIRGEREGVGKEGEEEVTRVGNSREWRRVGVIAEGFRGRQRWGRDGERVEGGNGIGREEEVRNKGGERGKSGVREGKRWVREEWRERGRG